jgi:hypothetical protein
MEPKYFDINVAATIIGVSPMTLRRAIKNDTMTFKVVIENYQKKYLVSFDDMESYITYSAKSGNQSLEQLKAMKEKLLAYKEHRKVHVGHSPEPRTTVAEMPEDFVELFRQQQELVERKIEQYEYKIQQEAGARETAIALAGQAEKDAISYQLKLNQKAMQLDMSNQRNVELREEISFLRGVLEKCRIIEKNTIKNNCELRIANSESSEVTEVKQEEEENKKTAVKIVYMDIMSWK